MTTEPSNSLDLVLSFVGHSADELRVGVQELSASGGEQDARLDALERRLFGRICPVESNGVNLSGHVPGTARVPSLSWDELVLLARTRLQERGVDPSTVNLEALLDPDEVNELRWASDMPGEFRCRLDLIDVAVSVVAGIVATVVDIVLVRVPRNMTFHEVPQSGSPLTAWLQSHHVDSDNWLARYVRVPFDSMTKNTAGEGLSPRTHRADTFGHDPLMGLIFGTIDILRGTSTGVVGSGQMFVQQVGEPLTSNPLVALVIEIGHLLSDVLTKAGLPLPGSSIMRAMNFGNIDGMTIGALSRQMYFRGYDSWHLMTMSTSVAAAELVLRAGWSLRHHLDADWALTVDREQRIVGSTKTGNHPRFLTMALMAHGVGALGNAGKLATLGGNPVAFNYAQWLRLGQVVGQWWTSCARRPEDVLAVRSEINLERLLDGWPPVLEQSACPEKHGDSAGT